MQLLWCWRCKADMPMLDEQEYAEIACLHRNGIESVKDYRKRTGAPLENVSMQDHYATMLARYEEITGYKETNPNAIVITDSHCTALPAQPAVNPCGHQGPSSAAVACRHDSE